MKRKYKALLFNFIGFAILFLGIRLLLGFFFHLHHLVVAIVAALGASILAPKFAVIKSSGKEKLVMKWVFIKGFREV